MLLALFAAALTLSAPPAPAATAQRGPTEACLYSDLTRDDWPLEIAGLIRRFPTGAVTRHIAWLPTALGVTSADPTAGPRLIFVYQLGERALGPLVQLSVSDVVVFDQQAPRAASFDIRVDGKSAARLPWPEYAAAAASFRTTGAPRSAHTERWPVWGESGAGLRAQIKAGARRLEVRLIDRNGRAFRSAVYDLTAQPLARDRRLAAAIAEAVASADPPCFPQPAPDPPAGTLRPVG